MDATAGRTVERNAGRRPFVVLYGCFSIDGGQYSEQVAFGPFDPAQVDAFTSDLAGLIRVDGHYFSLASMTVTPGDHRTLYAETVARLRAGLIELRCRRSAEQAATQRV